MKGETESINALALNEIHSYLNKDFIPSSDKNEFRSQILDAPIIEKPDLDTVSSEVELLEDSVSNVNSSFQVSDNLGVTFEKPDYSNVQICSFLSRLKTELGQKRLNSSDIISTEPEHVDVVKECPLPCNAPITDASINVCIDQYERRHVTSILQVNVISFEERNMGLPGHNVFVLIDTGASSTIISNSIFRKLNTPRYVHGTIKLRSLHSSETRPKQLVDFVMRQVQFTDTKVDLDPLDNFCSQFDVPDNVAPTFSDPQINISAVIVDSLPIPGDMADPVCKRVPVNIYWGKILAGPYCPIHPLYTQK